MHQASLHDENCFVTLTYDEAHMPAGGSLVKADFQKFVKRLRRRFRGRRIAFFHCGEYGSELSRPHYHALLFGFDFPDKVPLPERKGKDRLYRSPICEALWPFGMSWIGAVSFESAAYVARYSLKKVNGDGAEKHYQRVDPVTGEVFHLQPEYITMSLRPAIGRDWIERFHGDVYPSDGVVARGVEAKPPRYYDRVAKRIGVLADEELRKLREKRWRDSVVRAPGEASARRLRVKEEVKRARVNLYRRDL